MKRTGELEKKVNEAADQAEAKGFIERAGMILTDEELEKVAGGAGNFQQFARGSYVDQDQCIVYTVSGGDKMSAIAIRFGVTVQQICDWNNIKNPDLIFINQRLTIYPTILR